MKGKGRNNKDVTNRFLGLAGVPVDSWCGEKEAFLGRYHGYGNPVGVIDASLIVREIIMKTAVVH